MNTNKITQKMYIDYFKESNCDNYYEFIKNKLKSHESKCECIINCYMLFTFDDWSHITSLSLFQELVLQYPYLYVFKVICDSHYQLLKEIHNGGILNKSELDKMQDRIDNLLEIQNEFKNEFNYVMNNLHI